MRYLVVFNYSLFIIHYQLFNTALSNNRIVPKSASISASMPSGIVNLSLIWPIIAPVKAGFLSGTDVVIKNIPERKRTVTATWLAIGTFSENKTRNLI